MTSEDMTLQGALAAQKGERVAVNLHGSAKVETVTLREVGSDHFTIFDEADQTIYVFPFTQIVHIAHNPSGISEGRFLFRLKSNCTLFIKLGPAIEYIPG